MIFFLIYWDNSKNTLPSKKLKQKRPGAPINAEIELALRVEIAYDSLPTVFYTGDWQAGACLKLESYRGFK